jgi:hypothetical protein
MSNGMTVYVTLPGIYKEPINVPTDCTLADFCREVHHHTGVSIFNGFGFKGQGGTVYTVPFAARIIKATPDQYDNTGALSTAAQDLSASVIDADAGTLTTLADLGITHNEHLVFFSLNYTTTAAQQAAQMDANT